MRRVLRFPWRPEHLVAVRLLDRNTRVLPLESRVPPVDVPCLLRVLELLPWIAMRPARSPVARALFATSRPIAATFTLLPRLFR